MENDTVGESPQTGRREFLRRAAIGGAVVGGTWIAPAVIASGPAYAAGTQCVGAPNGNFTWNRTAAGDGQYPTSTGAVPNYRGGGTAPAQVGPPALAADPRIGSMPTGWSNHKTYVTMPPATGAFPLRTRVGGQDVTIGYSIVTFSPHADHLATTTGAPVGHGVQAAANSSGFGQSYRVSKDGLPPVGNIMTVIITFSHRVYCAEIDIADLDNQQVTGTERWGDEIQATGFWTTPPVGATGYPTGASSEVGVQAVCTAGNIQPAATSTGPWTPIGLNGIDQSGGTCCVSNLTLRATGPIQELRIGYRSTHQNTSTGDGLQHIALGQIRFHV